jgi:hypothetical protein
VRETLDRLLIELQRHVIELERLMIELETLDRALSNYIERTLECVRGHLILWCFVVAR